MSDIRPSHADIVLRCIDALAPTLQAAIATDAYPQPFEFGPLQCQVVLWGLTGLRQQIESEMVPREAPRLVRELPWADAFDTVLEAADNYRDVGIPGQDWKSDELIAAIATCRHMRDTLTCR